MLLLAAAILCAAPVAWGQDAGMRVWLPERISTYAPAIDRLFYIVLAITGTAFVLVQGTLLYFLVRYRGGAGRRATYTHGNTLVEIIWTAVPAAILIVLAFYSQRVWSYVRGTPPATDLQVQILAEQFAWNIRYAGPDGRFDTSDDITTINQLHLPVDEPVLLHLKSKDVIHSFFVPQFRVKQDAVPGITTRLWVQVTKAGTYDIACAELCGLGHYRMRGFLTAEPRDTFAQWLQAAELEQHPPPAPEPTAGEPGAESAPTSASAPSAPAPESQPASPTPQELLHP